MNGMLPCGYSMSNKYVGKADQNTNSTVTARCSLLPCIKHIGIIEVNEEATSKFLARNGVFPFFLIVQYSRPSSSTNIYEDVVDTDITMKNFVGIHKNKMD